MDTGLAVAGGEGHLELRVAGAEAQQLDPREPRRPDDPYFGHRRTLYDYLHIYAIGT